MIVNSTYKRPLWMLNAHIETIYPALFRPEPKVTLQRERIHTIDDDFLDLDWAFLGGKNLVLICHGMEGNSRKPYMLGMAKAANEILSWDALSWNYRGCSGEMNLQPRFYHSGATDDLDAVIKHCLQKGYQKIALIGFSLGGNLVLKYMGENGGNVPGNVLGAVAFSAPLHLESGSEKMMKWYNYGYTQKFLRSLKAKVQKKVGVIPEGMTLKNIKGIRHLLQFDDIFTGPLHGFRDAHDYYQQCSSIYCLERIQRPALVINARNDPFLSRECFPNSAGTHPFVHLEFPDHGGHCGFLGPGKYYWSEKRAMEFIKDHIL